MGESWDTMKRPKLPLTDKEEKKEYHIKGIENISSKITVENFPSLEKENRTPNR